ncbi:MAG: response regulator [Desulfobacterota bacterium]|nr:response regulator [Thermodesulfobacteriota bacterium]
MKRILIVDDSITARMFIKRCLEIAGCQDAHFMEAANGKDALALLKSEPADFVVADINMPVLDGIGLLRWIKSSPKLNMLPVVIISSASNPAQDQELLSLGAYAVLQKPISPPQLRAVIGGLIESPVEEE